MCPVEEKVQGGRIWRTQKSTYLATGINYFHILPMLQPSVSLIHATGIETSSRNDALNQDFPTCTPLSQWF